MKGLRHTSFKYAWNGVNRNISQIKYFKIYILFSIIYYIKVRKRLKV